MFLSNSAKNPYVKIWALLGRFPTPEPLPFRGCGFQPRFPSFLHHAARSASPGKSGRPRTPPCRLAAKSPLPEGGKSGDGGSRGKMTRIARLTLCHAPSLCRCPPPRGGMPPAGRQGGVHGPPAFPEPPAFDMANNPDAPETDIPCRFCFRGEDAHGRVGASNSTQGSHRLLTDLADKTHFAHSATRHSIGKPRKLSIIDLFGHRVAEGAPSGALFPHLRIRTKAHPRRLQ